MAKSDIGSGFNLPLSSLVLYATYIMRTIHVSNRSVLTDLRDLLSMVDPNKNYSVEQTREKNTFKFLSQLVEARLKGYENRDILLQAATDGVDTENLFPMSKLDDALSVNEIGYIESNINVNRNSFYTQSMMSNVYADYADFAMADEAQRVKIIDKVQRQIVEVNRKIKETASISGVSESLSISDEEEYEAAITHLYNRSVNGSTKLKCGMEAFNRSLNGGYESDRCYIYLGLPGEGKSSTLLNLTLQLKANNKDVIPKDPTKRPCILFLTMENTLTETLERAFSILVSDEDISSFGSEKEIMRLLREHGLKVTNDSPIDIAFRYAPSNSVDTDYLYTLYEQLQSEGKEVICLVQDYIKRIRPRDFKLMNGDMRVALGAVVDEFKEFAIAKHIPVITASQMNRDAAKIIDEGRYKNESDLVRKIGRSNIGESTLITENADSAFIIVPETGADGNRYLGVSNAKKRFKNQSAPWFYQPYSKERPLELLQDTKLAEPLFKTSLNELKTSTNSGGWGQLSESVNVAKPNDKVEDIAKNYNVSNEFASEVNKYMKLNGKKIITRNDVKDIVIGNGFMYGEMTPDQQDYLYVINGFDPENSKDGMNTIRRYKTNQLEDGAPRVVVQEAFENDELYTKAFVNDTFEFKW